MRLRRPAFLGGSGKAPAPHVISLRGKEIKFEVKSLAGRRFFLPRYAGGKLHEAAATEFVVDMLTPQSLFLDVGSNLGYFSIVGAHFARTVYAVEPQERMVGLVRANAALNRLANVHAFCAAAGDVPGFVDMPAHGRPGSAVNSKEGLKVPVIRLDDYFTGDRTPDVIKIDVEGYEFNVLKGAERILSRQPAIAMELHENMSDFGGSLKEILTLLFDHGYRIRSGDHRADDLTLSEIGIQAHRRRFYNGMIFCDRAPEGAAPVRRGRGRRANAGQPVAESEVR